MGDYPNTKLFFEQVLQTFSEVDQRILALHECSSEDFMLLNKTLKDSHHLSHELKNHVQQAMEISGDNGIPGIVEVLRQVLDTFEQDYLFFQEQQRHRLKKNEYLQEQIKQINLPVNNLRQNLGTLKLLLANIKLTNTFFDKHLNSFSEQESEKIEKVIFKVREACPSLEENLIQLRRHLSEMAEPILDFQATKAEGIVQQLNILKKCAADMHQQAKTYQHQLPYVQNLLSNHSGYVGSIITHLQFHDIIRQKMEHIQKAHQLIVDELYTLDPENTQKAELARNQFVLQIPQISEVQTAQLLYTNKDYQAAISKITDHFALMGKDMKEIAHQVDELKAPAPHKNSGVVLLNNFLSPLLEQTLQSLSVYENYMNEMASAQKVMGLLQEKFLDLDMIENAVEQTIIDKINTGDFLLNPETDIASQAQQILKLYADNHLEKKKIKGLFGNFLQEVQQELRDYTLMKHDQKLFARMQEHAQQLSLQCESLEEHAAIIDKHRGQIHQQAQTIVHQCQQAVSSVRYYDFFEKQIDELVGLFNHVNSLLKEHLGEPVSGDRQLLEQIENYYTMKSERLVHEQTVWNTQSLQDPQESEEGNDVELF